MALGYATLFIYKSESYENDLYEFLKSFQKFEVFDSDLNVIQDNRLEEFRIVSFLEKRLGIRVYLDKESITIIDIVMTNDLTVIAEQYSLDQIKENSIDEFESKLYMRFKNLQKCSQAFGYIFDPIGYSEDYVGLLL